MAHRLEQGLIGLDGLITPFVKNDRNHVYYIYGLKIDVSKIKFSKYLICKALKAEGVNLYDQYQNIHLLPVYQNKIAYGSNGFPWNSEYCKRNINYNKGICPNAEFLQDKAFFGFGICLYDLNNEDIDLIIEAFQKVWNNLEKLESIS